MIIRLRKTGVPVKLLRNLETNLLLSIIFCLCLPAQSISPSFVLRWVVFLSHIIFVYFFLTAPGSFFLFYIFSHSQLLAVLIVMHFECFLVRYLVLFPFYYYYFYAVCEFKSLSIILILFFSFCFTISIAVVLNVFNAYSFNFISNFCEIFYNCVYGE